MVDARLPDGSRLNAAIPPATTRWCCVTVRKFILRAHFWKSWWPWGRSRVGGRARSRRAGGTNIIVSGPTGSGKTTLINCSARHRLPGRAL